MKTVQLAGLINGFVDEWRRTRPATSGRFDRGGGRVDTHYGPLDWLAEASGVPRRTLDNLVSSRSTVTELRVADALIAAIGRPDVFHDGTLEIVQNPRATKTARARCCPGSLNGSLT